jgi:hypothetical protein
VRRRLFGADLHAGVVHEDPPQHRDRHQLQGHGDGKVLHEASVVELHTPPCIKERASPQDGRKVFENHGLAGIALAFLPINGTAYAPYWR